MIRRATVDRLERLVAQLPNDAAAEAEDDEFDRWVQGGCVGAIPEAGPLPERLRRQFGTQARWERSHRFAVALACLGHGLPMPVEMDDSEMQEVDEAVALLGTAYRAAIAHGLGCHADSLWYSMGGASFGGVGSGMSVQVSPLLSCETEGLNSDRPAVG